MTRGLYLHGFLIYFLSVAEKWPKTWVSSPGIRVLRLARGCGVGDAASPEPCESGLLAGCAWTEEGSLGQPASEELCLPAPSLLLREKGVQVILIETLLCNRDPRLPRFR